MLHRTLNNFSMCAQMSDCSPSSVLADLVAHGINLNRLALSSQPSSPSFIPPKRGYIQPEYDSGYESDDPMVMDDGSDDADSLSESSLSQGHSGPSSWHSRSLIPDPKFDLREAYLQSIKDVVFEHIEEDVIHIHDERSVISTIDGSYGYEPEARDTSSSSDRESDSESDEEMCSEPPRKRCRGLLPPADGPSWKEVDFQYVFVNDIDQQYEVSEEEEEGPSIQSWSRASGAAKRHKKFRRGRSAAASAKRELLSHVRPITRRFRSVE